MNWWLKPQRTPLIVAHRGSSAKAPENTLAAFSKAIDEGADAIELDVHLSKDGEMVVIHDDRLERTTDGRGYVRDWKLMELKKLSAGKWFHKKFSRERIPTLSEVLSIVDGRIGVNIEIKASSNKRTKFVLLQRCLNIVNDHRAMAISMISSFNDSIAERVKELDRSVASGIIYHPLWHVRRNPESLAMKCHTDYLIMNRRILRKHIVNDAHLDGLRVGVYTVNTIHSCARMNRIKVDCLFSDNPSIALNLTLE